MRCFVPGLVETPWTFRLRGVVELSAEETTFGKIGVPSYKTHSLPDSGGQYLYDAICRSKNQRVEVRTASFTMIPNNPLETGLLPISSQPSDG